MTPDDYLERILEQQTFQDDDPELQDLRRWRSEIQALLKAHFSTPSIRWAGSMAKKTMIRESYDGDMACYFPHDESEAGDTLEEIYDAVARILETDFVVERKRSALRVKDPSTKESKGFAADLHIDVVPGRFVDDQKADAFLHQESADKQRLKTNLDVHIKHIRDSGVMPAVRLMKLWNVRNGIGAKTFVLELLVVKLLEEHKDAGLARQLKHVWTELRDHADDLAVEDPANPGGNDLTPILDEVRGRLSAVAASTLARIEHSGWESVFGPVEVAQNERSRKAGLRAAAAGVVNPTKPWLRDA